MRNLLAGLMNESEDEELEFPFFQSKKSTNDQENGGNEKENSNSQNGQNGKAGRKQRPNLLGSLMPNLDIFSTDSNFGHDFGGNDSPSTPGSPLAPGAPGIPGFPGFPGFAPQSSAGNDESGAMGTSSPFAKQSSRQGEQALQVALQEVGVKEQPPGSNRGPRVDQYQGGSKGQYWCCHFVSWCVEQTGKSPFGHRAAVSSLRKWGKSNGKYTPSERAQPQPGDIFTKSRYDKAGKLVGGHTGFVQSYNPDNRTVRTVEGNVRDKVMELTRSLSSLDGFIRI